MYVHLDQPLLIIFVLNVPVELLPLPWLSLGCNIVVKMWLQSHSCKNVATVFVLTLMTDSLVMYYCFYLLSAQLIIVLM